MVFEREKQWNILKSEGILSGAFVGLSQPRSQAIREEKERGLGNEVAFQGGLMTSQFCSCQFLSVWRTRAAAKLLKKILFTSWENHC